MFADNKLMLRHLWRYHELFAEDPVNQIRRIRRKCSICGEMIARGDNATRHKKEVHGGEKRRSSKGK